VRVRDRIESDSIPAITRLLHRAYAKQIEMGLKPLAGRQGDDVTLERANNSECILALLDPPQASSPAGGAAGAAGGAGAGETIVGVILFEEEEKVDFPPWFLRPDVCHFAQFAVDPDTQGLGIGGRLLAEVERRARERDASELALSMAEPDRDLFNFYVKRGFRWVDVWQWPYTNYRSCIMSKMLL
jgi:GNAT superfamily N-acetyltransferase